MSSYIHNVIIKHYLKPSAATDSGLSKNHFRHEDLLAQVFINRPAWLFCVDLWCSAT